MIRLREKQSNNSESTMKHNSDTSLLADTIAVMSRTIQLFIQSVSIHLQSIDDRIDDLKEFIRAFHYGCPYSLESNCVWDVNND